MIVRFFSPLAAPMHSMFVERGTAHLTGPGVGGPAIHNLAARW